MSTEISTVRQPQVPALQMKEEELMSVLQSSVYPGAQAASVKMVIGVCRASGKDPLKKPYHIVPMMVSTGRKNAKGYDEKEWRDVIMPGINDYRTDAARTGQHVGTTEPEFGPDVNATMGGVAVTYPEWCRVTVKRLMPSGDIAEFAAVERWIENYATAGRDNPAPNAMWKKRPYGQIAKCAEAQALRKGFPEVGSQPTADEMEGKGYGDEIDITPPDAKPAPMPKPKAETKAEPKEKTLDVDPETGEVLPPEAPEAKPQGRPAAKPAAQEASTGGAPASAGLIKVVEAKIKAAGQTVEAAAAHFKVAGLEGIDTPTANAMIKWAAENAQ
jgi:phage recombination protein Bet